LCAHGSIGLSSSTPKLAPRFFDATSRRLIHVGTLEDVETGDLKVLLGDGAVANLQLPLSDPDRLPFRDRA
jgi:hypothetical protein